MAGPLIAEAEGAVRSAARLRVEAAYSTDLLRSLLKHVPLKSSLKKQLSLEVANAERDLQFKTAQLEAWEKRLAELYSDLSEKQRLARADRRSGPTEAFRVFAAEHGQDEPDEVC
eukprot:TRINITY_DN17355_c0_g1_i1.p1 TRINITY_DN17355_c0_g1~~TRINITY_DN17355_c0_g1_i1.p1  ORF type:complete len:115 (+),score=19.24 TRINITY_DN17355_c0_g1_i1:63-407(+)